MRWLCAGSVISIGFSQSVPADVRFMHDLPGSMQLLLPHQHCQLTGWKVAVPRIHSACYCPTTGRARPLGFQPALFHFVLLCFVLFFFPDFFLYSTEYLQQNLSFLFIYFYSFCLSLLKITSKQRKQNTKTCSLSQTLGQHIHLSSLHEALAIKDVIFPLYLNCSVTRLTLSECMHLTFCEHFQYTSKYHIIYQLWESVLQ